MEMSSMPKRWFVTVDFVPSFKVVTCYRLLPNTAPYLSQPTQAAEAQHKQRNSLLFMVSSLRSTKPSSTDPYTPQTIHRNGKTTPKKKTKIKITFKQKKRSKLGPKIKKPPTKYQNKNLETQRKKQEKKQPPFSELAYIDIGISKAEVRYQCLVVLIPRATAKLVQLSSIGEDNEGNLSITKNRKLISFLQKPIPSLCKSHLPVDLVLYSLKLYSPSPHFLSPLSLSKKYHLLCKTLSAIHIATKFYHLRLYEKSIGNSGIKQQQYVAHDPMNSIYQQT